MRVQVAGDGTTTATVLTRAIFSEGCKSVAAGMNPMDLRRGINLAVDYVVSDLKVRARTRSLVSLCSASELSLLKPDSPFNAARQPALFPEQEPSCSVSTSLLGGFSSTLSQQ